MQDSKNILVVRTDRVGDVVLTIPSIRALRKSYPAARISVWVSPTTRDLVEGLSFIDEVIVEDRASGFGAFAKLVALLRKKKFDLAIIYHTKKHANSACFLAGIPLRVGYKNNKFGFLLNHPVEDKRHLGLRHEAEYCMDLLKEIGVAPGSFELEVALQKENEDWAAQFFSNQALGGRPVVALHPSATSPTKLWPAASYAALAKRLIKEFNAKIVIVGDQTAKLAVAEINAGIPEGLIDLTCQTSVGQLASILKRCSILISNDSGPAHLAAAVGIPVISLFLRNQPGINPERWRPLGAKACFIQNKKGEEIILDDRGQVTSGRFDSISVQEVFLRAKEALFKKTLDK